MGSIRKKLNSESGLSILLAMFFLALCIMVSALVITSSLGSARATNRSKEVQQAYLTTSSVAEMMAHTVKCYPDSTYFTKLLEETLGSVSPESESKKDYTVTFEDIPQMDPVTMHLTVKSSDRNPIGGDDYSIVFKVRAEFVLNGDGGDAISYHMTMPAVEIEKFVRFDADGNERLPTYQSGNPILVKGAAESGTT